jgi:hypothetical protein
MGDAGLVVMLVAWAVGVVIAGRSAARPSRATQPGVRSLVITVMAVAGGALAGDLAAGGIDDASETLIIGASVGATVWLLDRALAAHRLRQHRRYARPPRG